MREFLAIVGDTWRQSKSQIVFKILCGLMLLVAFIAVAYPKVVTDDAGEPQFGLQFVEEPVEWLADGYRAQALISRMMQRDERVNLLSQEESEEVAAARLEAEEELDAELESMTQLDRSVQYWSFLIAGVVFTLSMLFFIGAAASYYPSLLQTGAVDVVLSKPLSRLQVFLGKYVGGLVLFGALLTLTYALIAVGLGLRTGVWPTGLFMVIPLQVFSAGVLYAIIAMIGVTFRSTALSIILGYVFYLVVDSMIGGMIQAQKFGITKDFPIIDKALGYAEYLPSFDYLKAVAVNSCLHVSQFEVKPVIVAGVWALITLGFGYWKFRKADF